jgi:hypothetical protein
MDRQPEQLAWAGSKSQSSEGVMVDALVQIAHALTKLSNDVAWIRQHTAHLRAQGGASPRG